MCDYSLMALPNRLAREGEELVAHRFLTGSIGFTSPAELAGVEAAQHPAGTGWWGRLREFLSPREPVCPTAVCIPPGARLRLEPVAVRLRREFELGETEEVVFTQIDAQAHSYRDAVRFAGGRQVRLQELPEGQRAVVVDLSMAEELDLERLRAEIAEPIYGRRL